MPWQLAILLQNLFASIYAIQSRKLALHYKQAHFQILACCFGILYVVFIGYALGNLQSIDFALVVRFSRELVLIAGVFTVWTVLSFVAFRFVDAATGTLLSALNLVAVVLTASFMLGEALSSIQMIGAVLLLLSIGLIAQIKETKRRHRMFEVAILLSILASICFGTAIAGEKYVLDNIGLANYAVFGIGLQFLFLLGLSLLYKPGQYKLLRSRKARKNVFILGLARGLAGSLFITALVEADNASLVGVLSGFKIVLTVVLGAILLKELTHIKRKAVAALIASTGVGFMLW